MSRIILTPYKLGSATCKAIKDALIQAGQRCLRVAVASRTFRAKPSDKLIYYGGTQQRPERLTSINPDRSIAQNKLTAFRTFTATGLSTVPWTEEREIANEWLTEGKTVVARATLVGGYFTRGGWRASHEIEGSLHYTMNEKDVRIIDALKSWKALENVGYEALIPLVGAEGFSYTPELRQYLFDKYINAGGASGMTLDSYLHSLPENKRDEYFVNHVFAHLLMQRIPTKLIRMERDRQSKEGIRAWEHVRMRMGVDGTRMNSLMQNLMMVEAPDKWAASKVREFHLGDIHHDKLIEENGIEFRWMGTITAVDAWSAYKGYVTATRKAQGILWGERARCLYFHLFETHLFGLPFYIEVGNESNIRDFSYQIVNVFFLISCFCGTKTII